MSLKEHQSKGAQNAVPIHPRIAAEEMTFWFMKNSSIPDLASSTSHSSVGP